MAIKERVERNAKHELLQILIQRRKLERLGHGPRYDGSLHGNDPWKEGHGRPKMFVTRLLSKLYEANTQDSRSWKKLVLPTSLPKRRKKVRTAFVGSGQRRDGMRGTDSGK